MPEISRFLGIVIRMYYREHNPPHFHAEYGEYEITVQILSGIIEGGFPKRALNAVMEWYEKTRMHYWKTGGLLKKANLSTRSNH